MRLSDRDRELLFEKLKQHAAAGRLEMEELEQRVAAIAAARTQEEAAAALAGLPALAPRPPERRPRWGRGHGDADSPAPDWHPTSERFRDPRTGKVMRVWVDPGGGRHYVADDAG